MSILQNEIVKLRAVDPKDVDLLYRWENNTEIWHIGNTLIPFSKFILEEFINQATLDIFEAKQIRFMIDSKADDKTVGCIDLFDFHPLHQRAGVGILINDIEDRKKHYASEALRVLIHYSFEVLMLHQIFCTILASNTSSVRLFENLGFKICGTKKAWTRTTKGWEDELMLQVFRNKI